MNSMARKWAGFFRASTLPLLVLGHAGCSVHACDDWACVNRTHLNGSVTIAEDVSVVAWRLCVDHVCQEGSTDLRAANADLDCSDAGPNVCLSATGDSGIFELSSTGQGEEERAAHDTTVQIVLRDQTSGQVIFDETRTAKAHMTVNDDCHQCWSADAML